MEDWKKLARELSKSIHRHDKIQVHERFQRGELRLSRINIIYDVTDLPPPLTPYYRYRDTYSGLFYGNLVWLASPTIFIALVFTAMQVSLSTKRLQTNVNF